jgi:tripartite-type tricarboxylate transporter receptor subunit TctC
MLRSIPVGARRPDCVSKDGREYGRRNSEHAAMLRDAPSVGERRLMGAPQHEGRKLSPGITALGLCFLSSIVLATPAEAQGVADFYRGKNVALAISFSPGGGYDLYARTLARHIGKYIPGNPAVVPQNMPGAGGLRVAQFFSAAAPRDGSTFGTFTRMAGIAPLFDPSQKYDAAKLTWLGAITDSVSVCLTWHTSPVKTWKDFLEKPLTLGGTGPGGELDIFTNLYKNIFNANVKLVSGYPGTAEIMLAMERGELDGVCGIDWTTIKAQRARWIADKSINVIAQAAFHKDPDLPNVPLIMELTTDREKLQILKLFVSAHEFARPYAAPPGIPADRAAALTAAFDATMKDQAFLAETAQHKMEVAPVSGKKLAQMLAELYTTPDSVLEKARAAISR